MMGFIWFWVAKAVVDFAIFISLVLLSTALLVLPVAVKSYRARNCKHRIVRETRACSAVCQQCGRDLGFIQTWRDAHKGDPDYREV